jgi:hypothetical protein
VGLQEGHQDKQLNQNPSQNLPLQHLLDLPEGDHQGREVDLPDNHPVVAESPP